MSGATWKDEKRPLGTPVNYARRRECFLVQWRFAGLASVWEAGRRLGRPEIPAAKNCTHRVGVKDSRGEGEETMRGNGTAKRPYVDTV